MAGAQLLELLDDGAPAGAELLLLVDEWAEDYNGGDKLDSEDCCNLMHLVGAALCVLLRCRGRSGSCR